MDLSITDLPPRLRNRVARWLVRNDPERLKNRYVQSAFTTSPEVSEPWFRMAPTAFTGELLGIVKEATEPPGWTPWWARRRLPLDPAHAGELYALFES
ncbi:MAG: hypothetical protein ACI9WU_000386 [Myxococcota bacterium]|jgi:hypothetical protein